MLPTSCDRKELLRTLLEEGILNVERKDNESHADLTLRWRGSMITKLDVHLKSYQVQGPKTDEDTLSLLKPLRRGLWLLHGFSLAYTPTSAAVVTVP